jgi:hypothetical protein
VPEKAKRAADALPTAITERLGLGRPSLIGCPREQSPMTPCVARDGSLALADDGVCVGCGADPVGLLAEEVERRRG